MCLGFNEFTDGGHKIKYLKHLYTSKYNADLGRNTKIPVSGWQVEEDRKHEAALDCPAERQAGIRQWDTPASSTSYAD